MLKSRVIGRGQAVITVGWEVIGSIPAGATAGYPDIGDKNILMKKEVVSRVFLPQ
jgi:hypothetical protein